MNYNPILRLNVLHRKDKLVDIFAFHPQWPYVFDRSVRTTNTPLINFIRRKFPRVLNEFRHAPSCYEKNGSPSWYQQFFYAYGLTKQEYLLLKMSFTFEERLVHTRTRNGKPVKIGDYMRQLSPTAECSARWSDPTYKPSPLRTT